MKKVFTLLFISIALLSGCGGGEEEDGSSCTDLFSLSVTQQIDKLHYSLYFEQVGEIQASFFEISYGLPDQEPQGNGMIETVQTTTGDIDISDYGWEGSTITAYARSVCADGGRGKWIKAATIAISEFCHKPYNITYDGFNLRWEDSSFNPNVSQFQVKYGVTGFTGDGTTFNTNTTSLGDIPMQANTTYDFYVRANCGGSNGWSSWSGPYTYYSASNQNMCLQPTNLTYTINPGFSPYYGITVHYNGNGEDLFEYALTNGATPTMGEINTVDSAHTPAYNTLSIGETYTFWVRGVCGNGNRTNWSTMIVNH
jgi:hypothetical protein